MTKSFPGNSSPSVLGGPGGRGAQSPPGVPVPFPGVTAWGLPSPASPPAPCGYNLTAQNGTIYSPGFPDEYPILKDCLWLLSVPPGHGVYLNFTLLQTEAVNDYIAVW